MAVSSGVMDVNLRQNSREASVVRIAGSASFLRTLTFHSKGTGSARKQAKGSPN